MIAVVGGTGMIGSLVVKELAEAGKQPRVLSRRPPADLPPGATHESFDMSRDDPAPLLEGVEVLMDLANSSSRPGRVLLEGTSRLLDSSAELGVAHFVGISIIGCEQIGLGYYKAKTRQQDLIRNSTVPWSLLKATQFHEFLDRIFGSSARFGVLPAGEARLQPVAAAEVGSRLCQLALGEPTGQTDRLVGPEVSTLSEFATCWKAARRIRRLNLPLPLPGTTGRNIREGALTDLQAPAAGPDFEQWLRGTG
jgi:uncharacterized protein YbjT (DUF2867 family)